MLDSTPRVMRERFRSAFRSLDTDDSGQLSLKEFTTLVQTLSGNQHVSAKVIRRIFRVLDADQSGEVSELEFLDFALPEEDELRASLEREQAQQRERRPRSRASSDIVGLASDKVRNSAGKARRSSAGAVGAVGAVSAGTVDAVGQSLSVSRATNTGRPAADVVEKV